MKKINLIGGVDSFGVAYTRDNKEHIGHLDIVGRYLVDKGYEVNFLDMYSMSTYNDTDYINEMLKDNLSIAQIRKNQRNSIDLCRESGIFQFIQLPKETKDLYKDDDKNNVGIRNFISSDDTMFVYSCGVNDFLKMMGTDLGKMIFPKNMKAAFSKIEEAISQVIKLIDGNFQKLLEINSDMEIYMMSIFIPTKYSYIRRIVTPPIELFNMALSELCSKYDNVHYVDNSNLTVDDMASVDWHPNVRGQVKMGNNIIHVIEEKSKVYQKY